MEINWSQKGYKIKFINGHWHQEFHEINRIDVNSQDRYNLDIESENLGSAIS